MIEIVLDQLIIDSYSQYVRVCQNTHCYASVGGVTRHTVVIDIRGEGDWKRLNHRYYRLTYTGLETSSRAPMLIIHFECYTPGCAVTLKLTYFLSTMVASGV